MAEYIKSSKPKENFKLKKPDYSFSKREVVLVLILVLLIILAGVYAFYIDQKEKNNAASITNFDECAAAGNPIMESYPERCIANDVMYVKQY